jgi:uncharacterized repeat protein (TIGR01451 family)
MRMKGKIGRTGRTIALIFCVVLCGAVIGCLGGSGNPGYLPNIIPGGDIVNTHAKPPGRHYFRNFDPKAICLLVSPTQATNPTRSQQVLIATVVDKDNQARRGRRVEWMLDGPGNIVEVDESGWTAGRGYKVDSRYAVSYTDYFEHTITRGNSDPRDDFTIMPGQTWCVVSSAVPGETTVTCYAPEVFNWEKGRAYVKLTWNDTDFSFPPPAIARYGGETNLSTTIARIAAQSGLSVDEVKVRYRILGGPPAVLINPASGVTEARAGTSELDILADADGKAPVRVIQTTPRPGKTQIAVEVIRPNPSGTGPAQIVGRTLTSVEWTAPTLALEVRTPKTAAVQGLTTFAYVLSNTGNVDSSPAAIRASLPAGVKIETIDPLPSKQNASEIEWQTDALRGGQRQEFRIVFKPQAVGALSTNAIAQTADGLRATGQGVTDVGTPGLKLNLEQNLVAAVGDRVPVKMQIRNTSNAVALENAVAHIGLRTQGLEHDTGKTIIEMTVGTIPPGQAKTLDVPVIAREAGRQKLLVNVTADGLLNDQAESTIEVRKAELKIALAGPEELMPGEESTYQIRVENAGEVPLPNVVITATPPPMISARSASDGGKVATAAQANWQIGTLAPGERKTVKLTTIADRIGERAKFLVVAASTPEQGTPRQVTADQIVWVHGRPALTLELHEPSDSVPLGRRAAYRVVVRNRGTGAATQIRVAVEIPEHYANVRGTGLNREVVRPEGNVLTFPVLKELAPGGKAEYYLEVEGAKIGDARTRASVMADYLTHPLREEQATRVIDRR